MATNSDFISFIMGNNPNLFERPDGKTIIVIKNLIFDNIHINQDIVVKHEVIIQDCTINGSLEIEAGKYLDRVIIKNTEIKSVIITGGHFVSGLFLSNSKIEEGLSAYNKEDRFFVPSSMSIENNSMKYISINNLDFEMITLSKNDVEWIAVANHLITQDAENRVSKHLFGKIKYFSFNLKEKTKLLVDYQEIENLSFTGTLNSAEITMNMIKVNKLTFDEFTKPTSGILNLLRIRPFGDDSVITIRNSFLGNTSFYDCDFAAFKNFSIATSYLIDVIYANTTWPKKMSAASASKFSPSDYSSRDADIQLRETYRQLKISAVKQGDKLQESRFYRNEMFFLNKTLKSYTHFTTKISLFLSWISNNYRQNWILPICWILCLNLFFVKIIDLHGGLSQFDWPIFFNILNPAHRFSDLAIETSIFNLSIDVLSRICNSFLIYQTITAFRKLS